MLACDVEHEGAVRRLRERKRRSDKPFALMARNVEWIERFCHVSPEERAALLSPRRPIVILRCRPDTRFASDVAPGNNTLGFMLPYTPLHYLLFSDQPGDPPDFRALVMTSGNISEEPIVTSNEEAWQRLRDVAGGFVFHNRDIYMRADDSVVRVFEGRERVLRRSRGYVPHPVDLGVELREILACGAELKNTFCLTKGRYAILSQHIGDLENYETMEFFEETLANCKKLFRVEPRAVAHDLHPEYLSTQFAHRLRAAAENRRAASSRAHRQLHGRERHRGQGDRRGVRWHRLWHRRQNLGRRILGCRFPGFERRAHLRYVPLAGGDVAVRQPWRMAMAYLRDTFGEDAPLGFAGQVPQASIAIVDAMLARRLNCFDTSSCGRLFDAVSSIVGLRHEVTFEGQAAIGLEMIADPSVERVYPYSISKDDPAQLDMRPMIEAIVRDVERAVPAGEIAAAFHNTLAALIVDVCQRIRERDGLKRVCLSGGTFQNVFLLQRAVQGLRQSGFEVFLHSKVPPNDGGIALGQAVIANAVLAARDGSDN